ncbi:MAG: TIGR04282 family arsenosugar biosynthesis glycosyltransferase [Desulfatibacillaceae bacterium]|nr:TIGR04282 family arsenosugar biosynthesis glycosyltransferase [Desulfatibacillaceae bacterium]
MPKKKEAILYFAKYPEPGRVKTRLADAIGNAAAANLYRAFVEEIYLRLEKAGFEVVVFFDPPEKREAFAAWLGSPHLVAQKQTADLGQRMCAAFEHAFDLGFDKAICLGSDAPDLPLVFVRQAFEALDKVDAVIGPCFDGGYYGIGFSKNSFLPAAFCGPQWGGTKVTRKSIEILSENSRSVYLAEFWSDVDRVEDLRELNSRNLAQKSLSDSLARLVSRFVKTLH